MSMPQPPAREGRAPILECVREGFAFIGRDWRLIVPVAAVGAFGVAPLEVWSDVAAARSDLGGGLIASLLALIVQAVVLTAFYRRTLSRGADPLALRLGGDERNVVGATRYAMEQALTRLNPAPDYLLIDHLKLPVSL
jgi:hypothetical protein